MWTESASSVAEFIASFVDCRRRRTPTEDLPDMKRARSITIRPSRPRVSASVVAAFLLPLSAVIAADTLPDGLAATPATHSHNDYYRTRPLLDALDAGMVSIEADIFGIEMPFVDDKGNARAVRELYIGHDWEEIEGNVAGFSRSKGTLAELYLDPLWALFLRDGQIYPDATLLLHADMKTATDRTWPVLENTLRNYPGLFTSFDLETGEVVEGPVTVYTNEEPDAEMLAGFGTVHSTADGRFGDIFDDASWQSEGYRERAWRMPIVSSNLRAYIDAERMFESDLGEDEIVARHADEFPILETVTFAEALAADHWALATRLIDDDSLRVSDYLREQLSEANRLGDEYGHLMRFWASPDAPWFWELAAPLDSVTLVTDRPTDASRFLESR